MKWSSFLSVTDSGFVDLFKIPENCSGILRNGHVTGKRKFLDRHNFRADLSGHKSRPDYGLRSMPFPGIAKFRTENLDLIFRKKILELIWSENEASGVESALLFDPLVMCVLFFLFCHLPSSLPLPLSLSVCVYPSLSLFLLTSYLLSFSRFYSLFLTLSLSC